MEDDDQDKGDEENEQDVETLGREEGVLSGERQRTVRHMMTCG